MRNPGDIFTEPSNIDVNTLKNLGPLTEMAGIWEGSRSLDIPPKPLSAPVRQAFVGQTVMAFGHAAADTTSFELSAERGVTTNGICSNPFLEEAFKTLAFRIRVVIKSRDAWTYDEDTTLIVRGQSEPFHHTDHGELTRVGEPTPNPLARG